MMSRNLEFFSSVCSKLKSRLAHLNRDKPLACTMDSVGVCHARPQGPAWPGPGPVFDFLPSRSRHKCGSEQAIYRSPCAVTARIRRPGVRWAHWCVTRVAGTPVAAYTGPPRGLTEHVSYIQLKTIFVHSSLTFLLQILLQSFLTSSYLPLTCLLQILIQSSYNPLANPLTILLQSSYNPLLNPLTIILQSSSVICCLLQIMWRFP